jgi:uncharacterized protein involved in type VI secretion and phage assembly
MSDHDLFGAGGSGDKSDHGTRVIQTRVVDNCDNARLGRVMVQIPWLEGPVVAAVATLSAGKGRGTMFTPQKDDEVLVLIKEKPDLMAYVIGALHTSQDTPPERARKAQSPKVQLIRTPGGHEIVFDDDSGELVITAPSGQTISLSKQAVEIRAVEADSKSDPPKTAALLKLEANGDITICGRSIKLHADSIEIKAKAGDCTIKGGPDVKINPT